MRADTVVVLDFETTGLSPNQGDRAIEIGAVRLVNGEVTEKFQALMNPGFPVTSLSPMHAQGSTNVVLG